MPLAHGWKGLSLNVLLTLQDDSGGFEFVGNAFQAKDKDAAKLT